LFAALALLCIITPAVAEAYSICETGANSDSTGNYTYGSNKCCDDAGYIYGMATYDADWLSWYSSYKNNQYGAVDTTGSSTIFQNMASAGITSTYYVQSICTVVDYYYVIDSSNSWYPEEVITPIYPLNNWRIAISSETLGSGSIHDVPYGYSDSMKRACWCRLKRKSDGKNGVWVYTYPSGNESATYTKAECYNQCPGICANGTYSPTENYEFKNLLLYGF
jgi:hypothetical protein